MAYAQRPETRSRAVPVDHARFMRCLAGDLPWGRCGAPTPTGRCTADLMCVPHPLASSSTRLSAPWGVYEFECRGDPRHRFAAPRGRFAEEAGVRRDDQAAQEQRRTAEFTGGRP